MLFEPGEQKARMGPGGGGGVGSAGLAVSAPLTRKSGHFLTNALCSGSHIGYVRCDNGPQGLGLTRPGDEAVADL